MLPSAHETSPYSLPVGTTREWHGCTLTLTAEGWRAEVKHSMHRRCKGWDYGKPWIYKVTLSTQHHDVAPQPLVDGYRLPPCISPGEKQVARAVMDAGYPLIVLFPQGIPPHTPEYKPYGKYFDACARGQLLILSPWEFCTTSEPLTRWQCLLLNDIAAQLAVLRHL